MGGQEVWDGIGDGDKKGKGVIHTDLGRFCLIRMSLNEYFKTCE
jgi:hypothetical protein